MEWNGVDMDLCGDEVVHTVYGWWKEHPWEVAKTSLAPSFL